MLEAIKGLRVLNSYDNHFNIFMWKIYLGKLVQHLERNKVLMKSSREANQMNLISKCLFGYKTKISSPFTTQHTCSEGTAPESDSG
jgi:hypothetical protein